MTRGRRYQRGQAIVLIAIMLAVLVGMGALAIDGSRAYALRRDLQAAVDAAALAAGEKFQQAWCYTFDEQGATPRLWDQLKAFKGPPGPAVYAARRAPPPTPTRS